MKRNKIIYVSGKYSGKPEEITENIKIAREYSIKIWMEGFTALCPHLNTFNFEEDSNLEYKDYIEGDLELLVRCDAIFMLPKWEESKGAKIEKKFAEDNNIPVFYEVSQIDNHRKL